MNRWLIVVPASVVLGALFTWLHVPAAWILGGIVAAGSAALATHRELPLNEDLFRLGRGVIGVLAAAPLVGVPARELLPFIAPGLLVAASTIILAIIGGLLLARVGVSRETGVLSLLAGGASMMPAIAKDVGADIRYVSLSHYLRLLVVSMTLPLVASTLDPPMSSAHLAADSPWWMWLAVPAVVLVGQPLGKLIRLPSASVFGPLFLAVLIGAITGVPLVPPEPLAVVAFIFMGWVAGGGLSVPVLKQFSRLLPITLVYIFLLMAACAAVGWVVAKWLDISLYEGYLATTPGALETALALSAEGGAGPAVVAIQLIRFICILIFAGYLPQVLNAFRRH